MGASGSKPFSDDDIEKYILMIEDDRRKKGIDDGNDDWKQEVRIEFMRQVSGEDQIEIDVNERIKERRVILDSYDLYNKSRETYHKHKELNDTLTEKYREMTHYPTYTLLIVWSIIFFILMSTIVVILFEGDMQLNFTMKFLYIIIILYIIYLILKNAYEHFNK